MIIGERLAERIEASNLTQAKLAKRVGMSQQAIGKLINGGSRGTTRIAKIARELGTTPEYLEGVSDDPDAGAPADVPLDYYQRELLECVALLTPTDRKALLQLARSLAGLTDPKTFKGFSPTVHSPRQDYRGKE
jgi:transcriptional regulator with XRE-family HTH domain